MRRAPGPRALPATRGRAAPPRRPREPPSTRRAPAPHRRPNSPQVVGTSDGGIITGLGTRAQGAGLWQPCPVESADRPDDEPSGAEGHVIDSLRARNEWIFAGILPRANRALTVAWWALLVTRGLLPALFAIAMGALVGAVQRGDRLTVPLTIVGVAFVLLQTLPPIHQAVGAESRQPGRFVAERSARACLSRPSRHGSPRERDADDRPHDGARLRPRDHRPTDVDVHGLHFERAGAAALGPGVRRRADRVRVVASLAAHRRVARHALAPARERRVAGPQHRGSAAGAAAGRLRVQARGRCAGREGDPALRSRRLGRRPLSFAAPPVVRAPLAGHAPSRAPRRLEPAHRRCRQHHRVLGAGR